MNGRTEIKLNADSSSRKMKKMKIRVDEVTKSLLEVEMLRNDVSNYSGFIRAKLFNYPLEKIQNKPEEISPIIKKLPSDFRKEVIESSKIDFRSLSQNLYEIMSSYYEIMARYDKDVNTTLVRNRIETEKVIDDVKIEIKFRDGVSC